METLTNTVLVISNEQHNLLMKTISDYGFLTIAKHNLFKVKGLLRDIKPLVVTIDYNNFKGDISEFILNIRYLYTQIPIIIFGEIEHKTRDYEKLKKQKIYCIKNNYIQLKEKIKKLRHGEQCCLQK
jgi:hypothetical protein